MKTLQVSEDYAIDAGNPGSAQSQKQKRPPNPFGGLVKGQTVLDSVRAVDTRNETIPP
jgi:hypothetical protein